MNKQVSNLNLAAVWSGGKDGCLSCFKAIQENYKVNCLLNLVSRANDLVSFHAFHKEIVTMQSKAVQIPVFQKKIYPQHSNRVQFEKELKEIFIGLRDKGIDGLIFGYVLPGDYQRKLVNRLSLEVGLKLIEPLYKKNSKRIILEFIRLGFKAVIVNLDTGIIDKYWLGRLLDEKFVEYLDNKNGVDVCGDKGEYHTLVIDGPLFKRSISIEKSSKLTVNGRSLLNIQQCSLNRKK